MLCLRCRRYKVADTSNPLTPLCLWKPSEEETAVLRAILPAPIMSRVKVQASPTCYVEQCPAFMEKEA